ncbi:MAG: hypothetical protein H6Q69_2555 [Firmicutes bacterium]|nr:hypothetical protein [Bacillota bacterium]
MFRRSSTMPNKKAKAKINPNTKQLSNPFSTGNGGGLFEARVQASFVVLMLAGGYSPCMPCWPICKIKLQGKHVGYDTDDMIVFLEKNEQPRKLLVQIKHTIKITENDKVFGDVIKAAWNDFNNSKLFSRGKDAIALITEPLSATDISNVRTILEWARHAENADEFINMVELAKFSNQAKKEKLKAFRKKLEKANNESPVSDENIFDFLRHFHLLGYDLDIKAGVTLSLLNSLIGQYSHENASALWTQVVAEVQSANMNAGVIIRENLPEDLQNAFKMRKYEIIPEEFAVGLISSGKIEWSQHKYASDLALANLMGAWNENNPADLAIIRELINEEYSSWIARIRDILQETDSPISLKNGKWYVVERNALWKAVGTRLFDDDIETLKRCAIIVLSERDPKFELHPDKRYMANVYGKVMKYSNELRKGFAESLALLGNQTEDLINCSRNKPETIVTLSVREILADGDSALWGSLNCLLPILAEADPNGFFNAVEIALKQLSCPFDELFSQEGNSFTGQNYLTGLLWALETLAWDEKFLVRACVILGELTIHDPGGNWANRPISSLITILLPWFPQTTASIDKRKVVLQTLQREVPDVAWKLSLNLLPNQHQSSNGTYKPVWRETIPESWSKSVTNSEYWEQVGFYSELAVKLASDNIDRLNELVNYLGNLLPDTFDKALKYMSSDAICSKPENERLPLWESLNNFILKHKRFSNAKWALNSESISKIEDIVGKLAPSNLLNYYRILFGNNDFSLFEENGEWEKQRQKLEDRRKQAVKEIIDSDGVKSIIQFAETVDNPSTVGHALGLIAEPKIDEAILPELLDRENKKLAEFTGSYVWCRQYAQGWSWVDSLDKSEWSFMQIGQFFSCLPFVEDAWKRVAILLGKFEKEYWGIINTNLYGEYAGYKVAISKLVEYNRPNAAINCLHSVLYSQKSLDKELAVKALLAAVNSSESLNTMDMYHIVEIIKYLQDDSNANPEDMCKLEWAYLSLLDEHNDATPKFLENQLASNPEFFCQLIRLLYHSKKEDKPKKNSSNQENLATNAWTILNRWKMTPGKQPDGTFVGTEFTKWLDYVKKVCTESGHLEVALAHIGQILIYCPPDPKGLWIDQTAADVLNAKDAEEIRRGFYLGILNLRGVHCIDPTGKPERELAEQYRQKADKIENAGYYRFSATINSIADYYDGEAKFIIEEHKSKNKEL